MEISVELTFSPLQDNYEEPIINLIKSLRASGLTVLENPLSTQVYGEYDVVMNLLKNEMRIALDAVERGVLYIKIVKSNRSEHVPNY